jgi:hypothetical protein
MGGISDFVPHESIRELLTDLNRPPMCVLLDPRPHVPAARTQEQSKFARADPLAQREERCPVHEQGFALAAVVKPTLSLPLQWRAQAVVRGEFMVHAEPLQLAHLEPVTAPCPRTL